MQRLSEYVTATATGTYCLIEAVNPTPSVIPASGVPLANPAMLATSTLYCYALTGVTGGVVVPVMMGPDRNFYPLATATTLTAAGFGFLFLLTTPALAVAIQVTTAIAGGSVYLLTNALQV